jgi:hypothetical protein
MGVTAVIERYTCGVSELVRLKLSQHGCQITMRPVWWSLLCREVLRVRDACSATRRRSFGFSVDRSRRDSVAWIYVLCLSNDLAVECDPKLSGSRLWSL